jgi:hypothetical protein
VFTHHPYNVHDIWQRRVEELRANDENDENDENDDNYENNENESKEE